MNETAHRLVDAARTCVAERGVAGTTSRDIAAAAGTNLQAITYHFGSKDRLVARALIEDVGDWVAPALEELTAPGDPATRMLSAVLALTAHFEERRAEAPAMLEALVQATRDEQVRQAVTELWGELGAELSRHVAALRDGGHVPQWIDPSSMAALLIAVANGLVLQVTIDPDGPAMSAMTGQLANLLLAARPR